MDKEQKTVNMILSPGEVAAAALRDRTAWKTGTGRALWA